jgi:glyoxylase-like metal-dependent hydrolase (beta-lactamase superfamily II)
MHIGLRTSRRLFTLCVMCLSVLAQNPMSHAENPPPPPIPLKATLVAPGIYMLEGRGGNILAKIGQDGILIVDDQFVEQVPAIKTALGALSKGRLVYILNTHFHRDHTGGNADLSKGATVIAHDNVRKRLLEEGKPESALPIITFSDKLSLYFQGTEIRAFHFERSHTDGDVVVYFPKERVLHTGDLFFNPRFPFVDLESGGNAIAYKNSVNAILKLIPKDTKIIPGHGPLATVEDFKRYRDMLTQTIAIVARAKNEKRTLESVKKAGLGPQYKSWGDGFIKTDVWIEQVWKSL